MKKDNKVISIVYDIFICVLAIASVILVILDFQSVISLSKSPYKAIDLTLLIIFWIDYITRLVLSKDKAKFFRENILDLIAIIPFNEIFSLFRVARLFRLVKIARLSKLLKATKLVRAFGFVSVIKKKLDKFFKTNGFIYMVYCSGALILISSLIMSYIEKQSFLDALWWSIVTCTTVGYGDISPHSSFGRVIAVILMLFGIGFIGMLTSTITTYFTESIKSIKDENEVNKDLIETIQTLNPHQQEELLSFAKAIKSETISLTVNIQNEEKLTCKK